MFSKMSLSRIVLY